MAKIENIIIWGLRDWDAPTVGRPRYLAECFAQMGKRTVFVIPPPQRKIPFRHNDFWRFRRLAKINPVEHRNGVEIFRPLPCPLPYAHHFTPLKLLRAIFIGKQLEVFLKESTSVLIVWDPKEWLLAQWWKYKGGIAVYDCLDLMSAFQGAGQRIVREERVMVRKVSLITCSAVGLKKHIETLSPKVPIVVVRNGIHWSRFQQRGSPPSTLKEIRRPRIGFIGSISYWIDIELVTEVAKMNPQWQFVFVGPLKTHWKERPANIHLLPPIPQEEVPACLYEFDVGLIPFVDSPLTRCVNPLKLYEYLACGKPVVATPYGDFGEVVSWVYFGDTPHTFAQAIHRALEEDSLSLQKDRTQAAKIADWTERAKVFLTVLEQVVAN